MKISIIEIKRVLSKLKKNKVTGQNNISLKMLKPTYIKPLHTDSLKNNVAVDCGRGGWPTKKKCYVPKQNNYASRKEK